MGGRIRLGRGLLRLGAFIQSLPLAVMRPDDAVEFSRQSYARPEDVDAWADDGLVDSGLSDDEQQLLSSVPVAAGKLLLLGLGGGREAIPLARMGFQVTGVDYVAAMVERGKENAARRGLRIEGLVQEISRLDVPADTYDVVWLSRSMYSCVPSRARRVRMVQRIARALRPGGYFLCQYHRWSGARPRGRGAGLRRLIAVLTLGNLEYEEGDVLWQNVEFLHEFACDEAVRYELEAGGLAVLKLGVGPTAARGSAVCRRMGEDGGVAGEESTR